MSENYSAPVNRQKMVIKHFLLYCTNSELYSPISSYACVLSLLQDVAHIEVCLKLSPGGCDYCPTSYRVTEEVCAEAVRVGGGMQRQNHAHGSSP